MCEPRFLRLAEYFQVNYNVYPNIKYLSDILIYVPLCTKPFEFYELGYTGGVSCRVASARCNTELQRRDYLIHPSVLPSGA